MADKLRRLLLFLGPRAEGRLDLWRTFGSHLTMATMDLPVLSHLFGHGTMAMVNKVYVRLLDSHVRAQMAKFDAAMPELPASLCEPLPRQIEYQPGRRAEPEGSAGSV